MTNLLYNGFKKNIQNGGIDLDSDTIKLALLTSAYTPDIDAHVNFSDVSANEVSGTGYAAGGASLANKTVTQDNTGNAGVFDADDVSWPGSTITARYGILYKSTGTPSTSPLIGYIDFVTNKISTGDTFTVQWDATGILKIA